MDQQPPNSRINHTLAWLEEMQGRLEEARADAQTLAEEVPEPRRLSLGEVNVSLTRGGCEVQVKLHDGEAEFVGRASGGGEAKQSRLAAEATAAALGEYLEGFAADGLEAAIALEETGGFALGRGGRAAYALVEMRIGDLRERLLGAALERQWGAEATAAAVLDALNRRLAAAIMEAAAETPEPAAEAPEGASPTAEAEPAAKRAICTVGMHVRPTAIRAALVDESGEILAQASRPCLPSSMPETVLHQMRASLEELLGGNGRENDICGIGIALAGRLHEGVCLEAFDFFGWHNVPFEKLAADELAQPVCLIGETKAALYAESRMGAGVGLNDVLYFAGGERLACAGMTGGRLLKGATGAFATAAHLTLGNQREDSHKPAPAASCNCGQNDCWQTVASDRALIEKLKTRIAAGESSALAQDSADGVSEVTPMHLWKAAEAGDPLACEVAKEGAFWVGRGLLRLVELFDPEAVVVAAPEAAQNLWIEPLKESLEKATAQKSLSLRCAKLGRDGPLLGAALLAREIGPEN